MVGVKKVEAWCEGVQRLAEGGWLVLEVLHELVNGVKHRPEN